MLNDQRVASSQLMLTKPSSKRAIFYCT
uniref:Uncharacterized protein n=1 Tax=Rhizophora mucronata TaxID=61149 RepID=A0A2P2R3G6_RHIMU